MATTMTPWERFTTAARMGIPDQVPFVPFVTGHFFAWFLGIEEGDYWDSPENKLKAQVAFQESWPDLMLYPGIYWDYSVAVEPSALGAGIHFPPNASPHVEPFLKSASRDEILAREPGDPYRDGLMPRALDTLKYMLEHCPRKWIDQYGYLAGAGATLGPTDVAGLCRGYDRFSMDLYRDPQLAHHLMTIATETCIRYLHAQQEIGGPFHRFQVAADSLAFLSPKHFSEFSLPYLQRIFAEFKGEAIGILHCDTNSSHLLDVIADVGMDVFNYGPELDTASVKQKIGERVCLLGNLDPLGALLNGTADKVEADCKRLIEIGKPDGGFILTMGSGTARGTSQKNIGAMRNAALRYGRYDR